MLFRCCFFACESCNSELPIRVLFYGTTTRYSFPIIALLCWTLSIVRCLFLLKDISGNDCSLNAIQFVVIKLTDVLVIIS
jgi:hypothetical protein